MVMRPNNDPFGVPFQLEKIYELKGLMGGLDGKITEYPRSSTYVDADPEVILDADPKRLAWYLFNLSSNDMYVGFNHRVASNRCILVPTMSALFVHFFEDPVVVKAEIWAAGSADSTNFYLFDVTEKEVPE